MQLVRGNGKGVQREGRHIHGDFPHGLDRVAVAIDILLRGEREGVLDRTDHAGLVVRPHQAGESEIALREMGLPRVEIETTERVNRVESRLIPCRLVELHRLLDRAVLDRRGEDGATIRTQGEGRADRGIVRLGAATGEDDLLRLRPDERGDLLPGLMDGLARRASEAISGRGIAVGLVEPRAHRLEHLWRDTGRGVVVEIDHGWKPRRWERSAEGRKRNAFPAFAFVKSPSATRKFKSVVAVCVEIPCEVWWLATV